MFAPSKWRVLIEWFWSYCCDTAGYCECQQLNVVGLAGDFVEREKKHNSLSVFAGIVMLLFFLLLSFEYMKIKIK